MTENVLTQERWQLGSRFWLTLWAVVVAVQVSLLANGGWLDGHAYRTVRWLFGTQQKFQPAAYLAANATQPGEKAFYQTNDSPLKGKLYKRTDTWWEVSKALGETFFIVVAIVAVGLFHKRTWHAAFCVMAGTVAAGALSTLVRAMAGRYRPVAPEAGDAETVWGWFRAFTGDGANLSWPSGHATAGFALAAALAFFFPRGRWLFVVLAGMTALSRTVMLAHFPADIVLGGALGFTVSWLITQGFAKKLALN